MLLTAGTDELENDWNEDSTGSPSPQIPTSLFTILLNNARSALKRNEFDTSFSWYCTLFDCLKSSPGPLGGESDVLTLEEVEDEFSTTVNCFSKLLLDDGRCDDANDCIQKALDIYPDNPRIHLTKANSALAVSGVIPFAILWKAFLCFNTREDDDDYSCEYQQIIDYFGHSEFVDRWHFRMLNDRRRNLAYKAAIQQVLNELRTGNEEDCGDSLVLFDLGCGTGLMSAFAADCGFKNILACDESQVMCTIAKEVLQPYCRDKVSLAIFNEDVGAASDLAFLRDGKIDVVVTEIFDCGFFGEKAMNTLSYVYETLKTKYASTKPFTMIPGKAKVFVTAVESATISSMFRTKSTLFDVHFPQVLAQTCYSDMCGSKYENVDIQDVADCKRITESCLIYQFDFNNPDTYADLQLNLSNYSAGKLKVLQDGRVDAFVVHFELELSQSCRITTNPWDSHCCTCWGQAVIMSVDNVSARRKDEFIHIRHRVHECDKLHVVENNFYTCRVDECFITGATQPHIENINNFSILRPFLEDYFIKAASSSSKTRPSSKAALVFGSSPWYLPYWLIKCQNFEKVFVYYVQCDESGKPRNVYYQFHAAVLRLNEYPALCDRIKEIQNLDEIDDPRLISYVFSDVIMHGGTLCDVVQYGFDMTKYPQAQFLPKKVNIYAQIISSNTLRSYNEIIDDQNVCGVPLKEKMSIFKSKTFFDYILRSGADKIVSEHAIHVGTIFPKERNLGKSFKFPSLRTNALADYSSLQLAYSFGLVFTDDLELKTHDYPTSFHVSGSYITNNCVDNYSVKLVATQSTHSNHKVYLDLVEL